MNNQQNPIFTVVIPVLNEEYFLPRLLNDLKKQTLQNFEVIVVDGKSEDATIEKSQIYSAYFPLRIVGTEKRNVSFQRNMGARLGTGLFLIFLDADTRIQKTFTKKLHKYIEAEKGLIFLPYVEPEDKSTEVVAFYQLLNFLISKSQGSTNPYSSVGGMIWEKNFFHLLGGFDEDQFVAEDFHIVKKASDWGVKGKFMQNIKITFSFRRINNEGKLQSLYKMLLTGFYRMFKGEIKEKIFSYEMQGGKYHIDNNRKETFDKKVAIFFKRTGKQIEEFLTFK
ncbi:MAG: glycosyltransferase [Candidatus Roizmanbacteria bacterium]